MPQLNLIRLLIKSLLLGVAGDLCATTGGYLIATYVAHVPFDLSVTPLIGFIFVTPLIFYFLLQNAKVSAVRDALVQSEAVQGDLLRRLQAALDIATAADASKSNFLAAMSHEIRTPLNGVLGMAQAMEFDTLSAPQRERLGIIRDSGGALLTILNDILDLSKIEAGKLEFESIPFSIASICDGVVAAFGPVAAGKGVRLWVEMAEPAVFQGDPTRVRQVLSNLVSNALKFTDAGEVALAAERTEAGFRLTVRDTGMGISDEVQALLFKRFAQADASTSRRFGGTGLGLSICKRLTEMMGGTISVVSRVGEGSTFAVEIASPYLGSVLEAEPAPSALEEEGPSRPLRVLAAEDNATNQIVLRTLLEHFNVDPVMVGNGREAIETWRTADFDLILMDIQMPEMDGPTAVREIRRLEANEAKTPTPIFALTANAMTHQVKDYLAMGMDGFIAKPIAAAKLYEALSSLSAPATVQKQRAAG